MNSQFGTNINGGGESRITYLDKREGYKHYKWDGGVVGGEIP